MTERPIVCTLEPGDLASRRDALLPGLAARADARETLPDGMRWRFRPSSEILAALVDAIDMERRCCRFLRFELVVEAGEGPVWLCVTGPAGTRAFLESLTQVPTA
jgi:hypothetical protein